MSALIANACWPARFFAKWLATFFAAVVIGAILAAILRPKPTPSILVQAKVQVLVTYQGRKQADVTRAEIYPAEDPQKRFTIIPNVQERKSLIAGASYDLVVQPMDDRGRNEGTPIHSKQIWPKEENQTIVIPIDRAYPKPSPYSENVEVKPRTVPNTGNGVPFRKPVTDSHPIMGAGTETAKPKTGGGDAGAGQYDWLSTREAADADLAGKSKQELSIMRNWVAAKHGHIFKSETLAAYFKKQIWYKPLESETPPTALEERNMDKIKQAEAKAGG